MVNGPRRLQEQVNRIQGSLAVAAVVFKKYLPIFRQVFTMNRELKRKHRVTTAIVFETIWLLFIALKSLYNKSLYNHITALLQSNLPALAMI